ncbi:hypothetical protein K493DRAFT_41925 [Basidiobolus meristosporus CBS 931.73]|uniref:Uncharacterized protein n=1 Tax=Basidiobolus meristosporus CBS 931.73 TaxID=1314790 RepID=A0A1Y1Y3U6_9FUNG|nr:hypothetical protein K493DRAFT_41925 [Basidiobolus meristosporus CBS 931.73]|eukprot:ORX92639.1 hypothetical protein K493DRAFT_41925 [Basidiobolus meristosporus CBS 931.73]
MPRLKRGHVTLRSGDACVGVVLCITHFLGVLLRPRSIISVVVEQPPLVAPDSFVVAESKAILGNGSGIVIHFYCKPHATLLDRSTSSSIHH